MLRLSTTVKLNVDIGIAVQEVSKKQSIFRQIPSIDRLLAQPQAHASIEQFGRSAVTSAYQVAVDEFRSTVASGNDEISQDAQGNLILNQGDSIDMHLHADARGRLMQNMSPSLTPVFNTTGTVLHTNLGRAVMPEQAIDAMSRVARQASNLEFNLSTGRRGERDDHVAARLCELTGAEAATVVNNNAAAVLIALNTVAEGASVAVSRGELVEIGGSFRIPDVMSKAGCQLIEVGTTNRTHLYDFEKSIADGASAIMKVHTSNYRIEGFSSAVAEHELVDLCSAHNIPFINDLGSGVLVDLAEMGLPPEPTVAQTIDSGTSLVTFSGDKLLGGPQCGIIVGTKYWIDKVKQNPLKRALRTDKHTLAALEALLQIYAQPETLQQHIPGLRQITRPVDKIQQMAELVLPAIVERFGYCADISIEQTSSQIGSGALPVETLPSISIQIEPNSRDTGDAEMKSGKDVESLTANGIAKALRELPIPVIGRIHHGCVLLDMRCIEDSESFIQNMVADKIN